MMKYGLVFLQLAVLGCCMWGVHGATEEEEKELMEIMKPLVMECIEECGLAEENAKDKKESDMDACAKKCMLQKLGLLSEDGKYDRDIVKKQILELTDNEEEATNVQAALDECFKGKEEELKDDKDSRKQVDLIYECLQNYDEEK